MSSASSSTEKKIVEKSVLSGISVPILIVLLGVLIVFGLTKMLSTERSHRDLVKELQSKTFGNRWVAAFELSKFLAHSQIPAEDVPWVGNNLAQVYRHSQDARTRNFIILALSSLKDYEVSERTALFDQALSDSDNNVRFNALVALGNLPQGIKYDWSRIYPLLDDKDTGLVQASVLALSQHEAPGAQPHLEELLTHPNIAVRYSAATGLIHYRSDKALKTLKEILTLDYTMATPETSFSEDKVQALKLRVLDALVRKQWNVLNPVLEAEVVEDESLPVATRAKEALNLLKK